MTDWQRVISGLGDYQQGEEGLCAQENFTWISGISSNDIVGLYLYWIKVDGNLT